MQMETRAILIGVRIMEPSVLSAAADSATLLVRREVSAIGSPSPLFLAALLLFQAGSRASRALAALVLDSVGLGARTCSVALGTQR